MAIRVLPRVQLGNPILRAKARKLSKAEMTSEDTKKLVSRMYYTLRQTGGVGIAAPQIGQSIQLAIVNVAPSNKNHSKSSQPPKKRERFVMINPKILESSEKQSTIHEGCLSFLGIFGKVSRPSTVTVGYFDCDARYHERRLSGLVATVFQHEYDHLQGVVWIDRATDTKSFMTRSEYEKLKLLRELEESA